MEGSVGNACPRSIALKICMCPSGLLAHIQWSLDVAILPAGVCSSAQLWYSRMFLGKVCPSGGGFGFV